MGFGIPVGSFLRTVFSNRLDTLLAGDLIRNSNIIDIDYARQLVDQHKNGLDRTFQLWTIFVFALWLERFAERIDFS
jgi:asparagine synthase (glutamine-hydrolysing)